MIVNPASTGARFAEGVRAYFKKYAPGRHPFIVSVLSDPIPKWVASSLNSNFIDVQMRLGNETTREDIAVSLRDFMRELESTYHRKINIEVVAGTQTGIEDQFYLKNLLLPGNTTFHGQFVPNLQTDLPPLLTKSVANQRLAQEGVRVAQEMRASKPEDLDSFVNKLLETGKTYPIVVKIDDSSGGDGFAIAHNREEAIAAIERILGKQNSDEKINNYVILQEYLKGFPYEYAPNGITAYGHTVFTEIFQYFRAMVPGYGNRYRWIRILPPSDPLAPALIEFAERELKALNYRSGAYHPEALVDPMHGIANVEFNGRMAGGGGVPVEFSRATGVPVLDLMTESLFFPDRFKKRVSIYSSSDNTLPGDSAVFFLGCPEKGLRFNHETLKKFSKKYRKNISIVSHVTDLDKPLPLTIDMDTAIIEVFLHADNRVEMTKILNELIHLEDTREFFVK